MCGHGPKAPVWNGPASAHSQPLIGSLAENPNMNVVWLVVPDGPEVIVTTGATVSTVNDWVAAVSSVIPPTIARTENV